MKLLNRYGNYPIHRRGRTIRFGCGAVTVNKSDLKSLAKIVQNKEFVDNFPMMNKLGERSLRLSARNVNDIQNYIKFHIKYSKEILVMNRLINACHGRKSAVSLLRMNPETLLKIAG